MKKAFLLLGFAAFGLWAAPVIPLPEVIARVDGEAVSSAKIKTAWEKALAALPDDVSPATIDRLFRSLAEEAVWQREIARLLAESGIRPDRENAEKYLAAWRKAAPNAKFLKKEFISEDSSEIRLKAALHFYLERTVPRRLAVSQEEAEAFYRANQPRFRLRGDVVLGIIETAEKSLAEEARALLLQGSAFDIVAEKYSPSGSSSPTKEILSLTEKMKVGETTLPVRSPGGWMIAQVRRRTPDKLISFEKALPLIRLELAAKKEGPALSDILKARLAKKKIEYARLEKNF